MSGHRACIQWGDDVQSGGLHCCPIYVCIIDASRERTVHFSVVQASRRRQHPRHLTPPRNHSPKDIFQASHSCWPFVPVASLTSQPPHSPLPMLWQSINVGCWYRYLFLNPRPFLPFSSLFVPQKLALDPRACVCRAVKVPLNVCGGAAARAACAGLEAPKASKSNAKIYFRARSLMMLRMGGRGTYNHGAGLPEGCQALDILRPHMTWHLSSVLSPRHG